MRIPTLGKNNYFFLINEIEKGYKIALNRNDEVMRLSMEEMLTALIRGENAKYHIDKGEEEIKSIRGE